MPRVPQATADAQRAPRAHVCSWHPYNPPPTTKALPVSPATAPQPMSPAPTMDRLRSFTRGTAMSPQAWHNRAAAVASIADRGAWFRTPGHNSSLKLKEYSDLPPFGRYRGPLPAAAFLGPVHRAEVAVHEERFYVSVLVPSCLQEFEGRLSWVNIWCSFNPGNPHSAEGVLFAGPPVDSSNWRLSGWVNHYLQEPSSPDEHRCLFSLSAGVMQQRWQCRRALSPTAKAW